MSNSYIHDRQTAGIARMTLRILAALYFILLAASIAYLWVFTKNRYITTAEFKISRQDSAGASSGLALALPGLSDSGSADTQMAIGHIGSADLLLEIEKEFDLVHHYSSAAPDYIFRMKPDSNLEERLEYYRKRITAHPDATSGMTTISVDTFEPELSRKIAARLLEKTEDYVNLVNQQIADKQTTFVRKELERAAENLQNATKELATLQDESKLINPGEAISVALQGIQDMKGDVFRTETELSSLLRDSPDSPRVNSLRSHIRSVSEVIEKESARLTGPEKDRLGKILLQYKQLELKIELMTRLRGGAELAIEKNRVDAVARSRFFTVVQNPYQPEDVGIPRRGYMTVTLLALGAILFLILRALTRSVFENA